MTVNSVPANSERGDEATRVRLLDAAIHIASTQGLDKVTYRSVGAQAGLAHSLVRFYFGTGDEMLSQALERAASLDIGDSHIRSETIDDFGTNLIPTVSGEHSRGMLQYDYLLRATRGGVPMERVAALYDFQIQQVARTLENVGIEDADGALAALILACLDGVILQHAIYNSDEHTEASVNKIREILRCLQSSQKQSKN